MELVEVCRILDNTISSNNAEKNYREITNTAEIVFKKLAAHSNDSPTKRFQIVHFIKSA